MREFTLWASQGKSYNTECELLLHEGFELVHEDKLRNTFIEGDRVYTKDKLFYYPIGVLLGCFKETEVEVVECNSLKELEEYMECLEKRWTLESLEEVLLDDEMTLRELDEICGIIKENSYIEMEDDGDYMIYDNQGAFILGNTFQISFEIIEEAEEFEENIVEVITIDEL